MKPPKIRINLQKIFVQYVGGKNKNFSALKNRV